MKMKSFLATAGLVAIAACSQQHEVYRSYFQEAGSVVDGGAFGDATMNNQLIQTGQLNYAVSLSNRFAKEVKTTVNFAFNSAELDEEARTALREQAKWIRQFPEIRFTVYGHTDKVGSNAYNKRLGLKRARAAVNYLVSQGVSRKRLKATVSFGETQPLIVTQGRERKNRRTVTDVSGFVGSHPLVHDGKYMEIVYREYIGSATPGGTIETDVSGG
jgi:outer membrane protein OmpA-like peptidoglycan-associated protein